MKMSLAKAVALAATLGAAASAQAAITLEANGLGQVLLYPLYTVENGNDTAVSVTNTTNEYKAVKVRFREALNSQDVLDFHLFLSPKDVWNGVVVATADGAKLITRDTSCTVPAIPADGASFTNLAYSGRAVETALRGQDGGPQDLKRTRAGYVEIIELGLIDPTINTSTPAGAGFVSFGTAIKHVNGVPGNCQALVTEYTQGQWKDTAPNNFNYGFKTSAQVVASTDGGLGGLYGVGTITNVFAGQQIGYDATALDGFIALTAADAGGAGAAFPGNLHNATGYSFPDLNGNRTPGQPVTAPEKGIGTSVFTNIGGATAEYTKTIDAVSAVLQRETLSNEFSIDSVVGAGTDWVVTFPTKHHYLWDSQIRANGTRAIDPATGAFVAGAPATDGSQVADYASRLTGAVIAAAPAAARAAALNVAPFLTSSLWKGANGTAKAPVGIKFSYVDREERMEQGGISFSPRPAAGQASLDYEANIVTFNNSNVLVAGDTYARYNVSGLKYVSGWATIDLTTRAAAVFPLVGASLNNVTPIVGAATPGLPAVGFATIKVSNGDLNGVLSNYNAAWNHKSN